MKLSQIALALATLSVSAGALAHGYIVSPADRVVLCYPGAKGAPSVPGINDNCGNAQWDTAAAGEGPDGYPLAGPADGQIASGGNIPLAGNMDVQTAERWVKHKVQAGPMKFSWHFTAPHRTTDIQYYITKQDWNPNQPLSRESFEDKPFCTWTNGTQVVNPDETMECNLPEREGYQVILGKWDVNDTQASFHKVIDVMYEQGVVSEWSKHIGSITPNQDLETGSKIKARLFDAGGERQDLEIVLDINSSEEGLKNLWSKAIAEKINASQSEIRAGQKNNKGEVEPAEGANSIYTRDGGSITSVVIEVQEAKVERFAEVSGIKDSYNTKNGVAVIDFNARGQADATINVSMFDSENNPVHVTHPVLVFSSQQEYPVSMPVTITKSGKYTLKFLAKDGKGREMDQTFVMDVKDADAGEGDIKIFPEGKGTYTGGTKVKQSKDGKIYECKSNVVAPWCNSSSDLYYEPGVGLAWQEAWVAK